tara:strand:- start:15 stop:1232 length:1218 start_codon:yes stop_codon:yes gene_type:complete
MNKMNIKNTLIALVATLGFSVSTVQADSPLYSIDSSNASEYADMLSPGQMAMFSAYPDTYRMDVYDSSGDCEIPADITAISQSNGALINDNEGFEVPNMGQVPFPDPSHPQHYVWNFRMNASMVSAVYRIATSANVQADGSIILGQQETNVTFPRNPNAVSQYADKNIYAMFMQKNLGPPRSAGLVTLVHDFIDSYVQPRKAWQYNPATRRVRRAPDITYDTVLAAGGGIVVVDQYGGFNGAQDKYDWSYEGSKQMLVPMGNDALAENAIETTHTVNHLNPDYVRYEARTVDIVHAQLKPGQRHIYESRTMYFIDDDFTQLALQDMYDGAGNLMRHYLGTTIRGVGGTGADQCAYQGEYTFDFATRTYTGNNMLGSAFSPVSTVYNGEEKPASFYTPDGLRRYAR